MPKNEVIRNAENNSISHLASAARQSASFVSTSLPFRGMDGTRDPQLVTAAYALYVAYPNAEWIRIKTLSHGRLSVTIKAAGMKTHARGYGIGNALLNLCSAVDRYPALRDTITHKHN